MSSSKTQVEEKVDNSTKVTTTNQQATASEGSTAIGAGANVTIESVDAQVISRGFDSVDFISGKNQELAKTAIEANQQANESALAFGRDVTSDVNSTLSQANSLLAKSFESSANILQRQGSSDEFTDDRTKNQNSAVIIGGIILAFVVLMSSKKGK